MEIKQNTKTLYSILKGLNGIDIYITYRCNLRCKYCFIGEKLNLNTDFDYSLLINLVKEAKKAGLTEITFLGGEPTLYPNIKDLLLEVNNSGMTARIVTNGGPGFSKLISKINTEQLPHTCFSLDGATKECHDTIRGHQSYKHLIENVAQLKKLNGTFSIITSIYRQNAHEVEKIIELSDELGAKYLNIHYVSSIGFAKDKDGLSIEEWNVITKKITKASEKTGMTIRLENIFKSNPKEELKCSVRTNENLMFFPNSEVYKCNMFLDVPNSYSYLYTKNGIIENSTLTCENQLCKKNGKHGCPATKFAYKPILPLIEKENYSVGCIYDKTCLSFGKIISDLRL